MVMGTFEVGALRFFMPPPSSHTFLGSQVHVSGLRPIERIAEVGGVFDTQAFKTFYLIEWRVFAKFGRALDLTGYKWVRPWRPALARVKISRSFSCGYC
jgi:hypothetical protein